MIQSEWITAIFSYFKIWAALSGTPGKATLLSSFTFYHFHTDPDRFQTAGPQDSFSIMETKILRYYSRKLTFKLWQGNPKVFLFPACHNLLRWLRLCSGCGSSWNCKRNSWKLVFASDKFSFLRVCPESGKPSKPDL